MSVLMALLLMQAGQTNIPLAFPPAFHGVWDADAEACSGGHSDMRIKIDANGIGYWESEGKPVEIFTAGENDILVALAMLGEEQKWRSHTRFVLDRSGERMFAEAIPQAGEDYFKTIWFYQRCPDGTPMGWGSE